MSITQDEAFKTWLPKTYYEADRRHARAGWDARGEHDAAELARKDELLAAYRKLDEAYREDAYHAIKGHGPCPRLPRARAEIARLEAR